MKDEPMKTTTKTYQNANSAEKAAAAKTKKTGIEYFAFEIDQKWVILTTEEFDALESPAQDEEQVEEPSIHVNGSLSRLTRTRLRRSRLSRIMTPSSQKCLG